MGRFMRAPDGHEGGGDNQGGDSGSDGAGSDAGAGKEGAGDAGKSGQESDAGDGDDTTALGGAGDEADADDGAGADGKGDKAEKGSGDADDDEAGPPETYELKLTQVTKDEEGKDVETAVEMDPVLVEKATPILKDVGLNNEQANKLVQLVPQIQQRLAEQQADQHAAMRADWAKAAKADADIGGKNWSGSLNLAAKALDHLGHPKGSEFRQLLDETGLGNHPAMVKVFRDVGKMIKEDDLVRGDAAPAKKGDRLAEQYPDDVPQADKK